MNFEYSAFKESRWNVGKQFDWHFLDMKRHENVFFEKVKDIITALSNRE